MKFVEFPGYGVNASRKYINAERVVSFWHISYNGLSGTEIAMDDDSTIRVQVYPEDVKRALEEVEAG